MGVAWYITLDRDAPGAPTSRLDGKAVARAHEQLDQIARELGLAPPSSFLSQSAEDASAMAAEMELELDELPPERWSPAEAGLEVVRGLLGRVRETGGAPALVADLEGMECVLRGANDAGARFHFTVDF